MRHIDNRQTGALSASGPGTGLRPVGLSGETATARVFRCSTPVLLATVVGILLLGAGPAAAQVQANRVNDDTCLVSDFQALDDVVMTSVATHQGGVGDVYQAICDDEDCWGFSINRNAGVNVLTTGLTPGDYQWFICAWNGSVRRVVANITGGAALFGRRAGMQGAPAQVRLITDPRVPPDIRRYAAKLDRSRPAGN